MTSLQTDRWWHLFVFSGVGSCVAEFSTVPIDVVKVRMQLQGEGGATRVYANSLDAVKKIFRHEGLLAFYKGVQPALLRQATYGSIRIGLYEPIKARISSLVRALRPPPPATTTPTAASPSSTVSSASTSGAPSSDAAFLIKVLSGMASGAFASGLCNPTDVVKIRMQADGMLALSGGTKASEPRYRGLVHAFTSIAREEGMRGLYKGVSPTMQRAAVVAGVELSTYDQFKQWLVHLAGMPADSIATHFMASFSAGFLATLASSPTDVIKSRVMNQPVDAQGRGLRYTSTLDCLRQSVRAEGVLSLWKGFGPNFARLAPHSVIMFLVIEQLRNAFARKAEPSGR